MIPGREKKDGVRGPHQNSGDPEGHFRPGAAIAELYRYFSEFRAAEKEFWIALRKMSRSMPAWPGNTQMLLDRNSFAAPNGSFNASAVVSLKNFVERHHRKLQKLEIPTDFKSLSPSPGTWNIPFPK